MTHEQNTLAFDLGGTKIAAALVREGRLLDSVRLATREGAGPDDWIADMSALAANWRGRFCNVGIAVTGVVRDGYWSALNRATLDVGVDYPLVERLHSELGQKALAVNDAQAAAWGEYCYGAGQGRDMIFLTVSTGVGGGIVLGGRLWQGNDGLAGHVGQIPVGETGQPFENEVSGRWFARAALAAGHPGTAKTVFQAAAAGERWADAIILQSAARMARLCETLQAILAPDIIVIGGGIGLAEGYLEHIDAAVDRSSRCTRVKLFRASLRVDAGLLGVADLVNRASTESTM
jgi:predicted NBD/HSP70 family sugar kinase